MLQRLLGYSTISSVIQPVIRGLGSLNTVLLEYCHSRCPKLQYECVDDMEEFDTVAFVAIDVGQYLRLDW